MPKTSLFALVLLLPLLAGGCAHKPPTAMEASTPEGARELWPVPRDEASRIEASGLPTNDHEEAEYHIHAQLEVYKNGKQVIVPAGIGIDGDHHLLCALHTHLNSGVIHVENPTPLTATLGQFFALWGVPLDGAHTVVNGHELPDGAGYALQNGDLITVFYGEAPANLYLAP